MIGEISKSTDAVAIELLTKVGYLAADEPY